jgi:hypothetical protein
MHYSLHHVYMSSLCTGSKSRQFSNFNDLLLRFCIYHTSLLLLGICQILLFTFLCLQLFHFHCQVDLLYHLSLHLFAWLRILIVHRWLVLRAWNATLILPMTEITCLVKVTKIQIFESCYSPSLTRLEYKIES